MKQKESYMINEFQIDQLKTAIKNTVTQFKRHPFDFLSERDIQALLFAELRNSTNGLRYRYDAGGANARFGFAGPFTIHPVTTEYYVSEGKLDVAVLSEKPDSATAIWRQPCRVAIEIKLWQPCEKEPKYFEDVEKLQRYQARMQKAGRTFTGIAMLFVHPCVNKMPSAISEEWSGEAYPENGIALHLITNAGHWWKQQSPAPSVPEQVGSFAQTS
jgi:hypothetical protein